MPSAMSATRSGLMPLPGRSAMTVASPAADGILPIAMPPSLTKSCDLRSRALPTPRMTRRATSRPDGATMSSADPLLPLKRSAAVARVTRSPADSIALRAAEPNLTPSSQNTTRTPLDGAAKDANSSLRAPDMQAGPSMEGAGQPAAGRLGGDHRYDPVERPWKAPRSACAVRAVGEPHSGATVASAQRCRIKVLLCIVKGFALAKPLCCGIKKG